MNPDKASYKKSSFGPAFFFLDKRRRTALAVYYAFCRLMDDLADEPGVENREAELNSWREEIRRVYSGNPQTELGKEIAGISQEFGIPENRFSLLIEGMLADVHGKRYATQKELDWYLWRVACIVGLATLDILGVKGHKAEELSLALGSAVQLTNIVRDVHADALLGRVYLPEDLLAEHALTRQDVLQNTQPQKLACALAQLSQKSYQLYAQADKYMLALPARKMLPCCVMSCVYRANLAKIEKKGFVFDKEIKLSKPEKMLQGIYALLHLFAH